MERFTISLDDRLAEQFDAWPSRHKYANRSEAVRDLLRAELGKTHLKSVAGKHRVACLSYVFNHHERNLAERLTTRTTTRASQRCTRTSTIAWKLRSCAARPCA